MVSSQFKLNCAFITFFFFICVASDGVGKADLDESDDVGCLQFLVGSYGERGDHFGVGPRTHRGHKTGVDCTLAQSVLSSSSSSISLLEGSSARVDPHVEEYLRQSYEQNLQIYESHRMM